LRNEARIALCPDRVSMTLVARGWRPRVIAKHAVSCSGASADWRPCIEALELGLSQTGWQDADATVILSNHFVRYALVPWSEHLASDDEKRIWVRHHFADLYGEAAAKSEYRWSEDRPDSSCVASAVAADFVSTIRSAFEPASLTLKSIQPYLMAVFNRLRPRIKGDPAWILVPESGRVCLATVAGGRWRKLTFKSLGADWRTDLTIVLEREFLLADEPASPKVVFAYAPGVPAFDLPDWTEVPVNTLAPRPVPGFSPSADAEYAMALTGIA
jgi:hypothetical protein